MNRKIVAIIGLMIGLIVLFGWFLPSLAPTLDPIRQYITANGAIQLHGTVSGAFLNYLQHGPPQSNVVHFIIQIGTGSTTIAYRESSFDVSASSSAAVMRTPGRTPSIGEFLGYVIAPIRMIILAVFDGLTGTASAACTGGNCFWIGGTGNFSSTAHWSTTSGGAACTCTPGATDTVTFDAASGAGTATEDNATFTSGAVTMTNSSVTIDGSTNTWNVAGSFLDANGHWTSSTSKIVFTATGTVTLNSIAKGFYDVTMAPTGGTTTISGGAGLGVWLHVLTLGTGTVTGGALYNACGTCNTANIFINGGATIGSNITFDREGSTQAINIPGFTTTGNVGFLSDSSYTATMTGAVTSAAFTLTGFGPGTQTISTGSNFSLTVTTLTVGASSILSLNASAFIATGTLTLTGGITAGASGAKTIQGAVTINAAGYFSFGGASWFFDSTWTNNSTSGSWSNGSGTVTFESLGASNTMSFANLGASEFNNVTFNPGAAFNPAFIVAVNRLVMSGTLTISSSDVGGTSELRDSTNNKGITAGAVVVGIRGTLTMGTGTFIVKGNWTSSAGTYIFNTSKIEFAQNGTLTTVAGGVSTNTIYDLQIDDLFRVVLGSNVGIQHILTINTPTLGGLDSSGVHIIALNGALASPLSLSVGSNTTWCGGTDNVQLVFSPSAQAAYNLPAGTYACRLILEEQNPGSIVTVTAQGNISNPSGFFLVTTLGQNDAGILLAMSAFNLTSSGSPQMLEFGQSGHTGETGWKSALTFTTGCVSATFLIIITTTSYVNWGSCTTHSIGFYQSYSTSASWSAGTGKVTITSTGGMNFSSFLIAGNEFNDLSFLTAISGTITMQSGGLKTSTITIDNPSGGSTLDTNSLPITTTTLTILRTASIQMRNSTVTVTNWDVRNDGSFFACSSAPSGCSSTQIVVFVGTGTAKTSSNTSHGDFWNIKISPAAVITFTLPTYIGNAAEIDGKIISGVPNNPIQGFGLLMFFTSIPLTLGVGYDLSASGFLTYWNKGPNTTFYVTGGNYQALQVFAKPSDIVHQLDDVWAHSLSGSVNYEDGEIILRTQPEGNATTFTYYTDNHIFRADGVIFLGDAFGQSVDFHAGSSTITASNGFNPRESSKLYLETSTLVVHPISLLNPVAFYVVGSATVYGGTANVTVHGKFRMWPAASAGASIIAGAMTITILADEGTTSAYGVPGDMEIAQNGQYIAFGSSQWTIKGNWTNVSTSGLWNAPSTAIVTFSGTGTQTIANNGAPLPRVLFTTSSAKQFTQSLTTSTVSTTITVTLTITAGVTWTMTVDAGTFGGAAGQKLTLRSSSTGNQWTFRPMNPAAYSIHAQYLDVKDSNAITLVSICDGTSTDSGNNVNWDFTCQGAATVQLATNTVWLFFFLAVLIMLIIGAVKIRAWREG